MASNTELVEDTCMMQGYTVTHLASSQYNAWPKFFEDDMCQPINSLDCKETGDTPTKELV